jgi:hypothetical protein
LPISASSTSCMIMHMSLWLLLRARWTARPQSWVTR